MLLMKANVTVAEGICNFGMILKKTERFEGPAAYFNSI
jgi:hypothetical protein